jgi:uncharacterized membrane protein YeaQ/YmgE (transglycosylase-associated protein family)
LRGFRLASRLWRTSVRLMEFILAALLVGLIVGGLARFAVPGPDPMPIWMTILVGIAGTVVGGVAAAVFGIEEAAPIFAIPGAIIVVIGYRRYVQQRGITGPEAQRFPTRGVGVEKRGGESSEDDAMRRLRELGELRDAGVITPEEFETKKAELLSRI